MIETARLSPPLTEQQIENNCAYIAAGVDPCAFWCLNRQGWNDAWIDGYWNGYHNPHRRLIVEVLQQFTPVASVLEVGCHCGPNLRLLAEHYPGVELHGVDLSDSAVTQGRASLAAVGVKAKLTCGFIPVALAQYADDQVEWVLSCFALAYVPPDRLAWTLREMWRIASRGLLIYEPQAFTSDAAVRREDPGLGPYIDYTHCYLGALLNDRGFHDAVVTVFERPAGERLNALMAVYRDGTNG